MEVDVEYEDNIPQMTVAFYSVYHEEFRRLA